MNIINIYGSKNTILPLLALICIYPSIYTFVNVPNILDLYSMLELLNQLNIKNNYINNILNIDSSNIIIPEKLYNSNNIRGNIYFFAILARYKLFTKIQKSGGCLIGKRSIEMHIEYLKNLNIEIKQELDFYNIDSTKFLIEKSINYKFNKVSVGATINAIFGSIYGKGKIELENCSKDLHIIEIIKVLNMMGVDIKIENSKITIIRTLEFNKVTSFKLLGDPIITGTYIIFGTLLNSKILYNGMNLNYLGDSYNILRNCGILINQTNDNKFKITRLNKLNNFSISTQPYPGIATDLMPLFVILASQIGDCLIEENIFENRFKFIEELKKINFDCVINNKSLYIKKKIYFYSKKNIIELNCTDIRGGMAIILASCILLNDYPNKVIHLKNINYVKRGYHNLEDVLKIFNYNIINKEGYVILEKNKVLIKTY